MYAIKNEIEDRLFIERSGSIKRMKPYDIMIYLGIKEKFIIGDHSNHARISYINLDHSKYSSIQREPNSPFKSSDINHT